MHNGAVFSNAFTLEKSELIMVWFLLLVADDEEVKADEAIDEFSDYFSGKIEPKMIITTCLAPSKVRLSIML